MTARIDHELIRRIIIEAIGPHSCIHEARENGVWLVRQRDRAVELAMPMGAKIAQQYRNRMPDGTRVEIRDLEQAGRLGVLEGIDRYKPNRVYQSPADKKAGRPGRPVRVDTYLFMWIKKRVLEEVADTHWLITKPPRDERERFFKDEMSEGERIEYANLVLSPQVQVDCRMESDWLTDAEWRAQHDLGTMLQ